MKRVDECLDTRQVLHVIESYASALNLLDDYDHQRIQKPEGSGTVYHLTYEECRQMISAMHFSGESSLFGNEKDESFRSSIGAIYQTFGGKEVYASTEEKAANLLYFITKNHSFSDGNKRIDDYALAAITIMIAESRPEEKELMVNLVMKCLV